MEDLLHSGSRRPMDFPPQASGPSIYHPFSHSGSFSPFNDETGTLGPPAGSLEPSDFFSLQSLAPDAYMSLDGAEIYDDYDNLAPYESHQVPLDSFPTRHVSSGSPGSSRFSEVSQNVSCDNQRPNLSLTRSQIIPEHYGRY